MVVQLGVKEKSEGPSVVEGSEGMRKARFGTLLLCEQTLFSRSSAQAHSLLIDRSDQVLRLSIYSPRDLS